MSFDTQGNVIGLIIYEVDRVYEIAFDFGAINFTDNKVVFGKDLFKVLDDIFCKFNIPKMEFCCVIGNPIERSYDRMIKKFGGNIIGVRKQHCKLHDNQLYNDKIYELFRDNYIKSKLLPMLRK